MGRRSKLGGQEGESVRENILGRGNSAYKGHEAGVVGRGTMEGLNGLKPKKWEKVWLRELECRQGLDYIGIVDHVKETGPCYKNIGIFKVGLYSEQMGGSFLLWFNPNLGHQHGEKWWRHRGALKEPDSFSSLIQHIFAEHLQSSRHYSRHWRCNSELHRQHPALMYSTA